MENKVIYVDNNATTAIAPEVFEAMVPYLTHLYGNPSSIHRFGGQCAEPVETARGEVARLIGADPKEVIFTSCGTESDNAAIFSATCFHPDRKKIVISAVEHPAVINTAKELERRGYAVEMIPVDRRGCLDLEAAERMIDFNTAVVSVMYANNEIGNIYPVETLSVLSHRVGALFHTDAVQAVGKVPMEMRKSAIDMLSLSGHKLHAPKGIGALYLRRGIRFRPYVIGGHQEFGRRGGTENVASIVGLGVAAKLAAENMETENIQVRALRDRLESEVIRLIPRAYVNGDLQNRLPNTSSISFECIEGEAILMLLDQHGICASSGSACTTGSLEPSHVLRAMGVPYTCAHGTIRFSFSRYNTMNDVDTILKYLPKVIERLRSLSPYWPPTDKR